MDYEIILSNISFKEGRDYIKNNIKEVYEVKPGYKLFGIYLIGIPPIFVGIEGDYVIFPYIKPCHGAFVLKMKGVEELERLRAV